MNSHVLRCAFTLLLFAVLPLEAQLVIKLSPQTVAAFDQYAAKVKGQMNERWGGARNFLYLDDNPSDKNDVLSGKVVIRQMTEGHPLEIHDGLIHDWLGAVFIPHASLDRVIALLEDFDRHKDIYPAIGESHTIERKGKDVKGYWQLQQKGLVPVILDVEENVHYAPAGPGKWHGEAYANSIIEVDTGFLKRGRKFPLGEGHGYLWRLYGYWSLVAANGGVLAECRTLSLSRDVPEGLAWAVGPYVQKMPQDSLTSTLTATRKALLQGQ